MNKYAQVALIAAERIENGMQPRAAWEQASCEIFPKGSASQTKGCPKNAFFGLYEPKANTKNGTYAREALAWLRAHPDCKITPSALWKIVLKGETKAYNSQMDVVIALYQNGYIY